MKPSRNSLHLVRTRQPTLRTSASISSGDGKSNTRGPSNLRPKPQLSAHPSRWVARLRRPRSLHEGGENPRVYRKRVRHRYRRSPTPQPDGRRRIRLDEDQIEIRGDGERP